MSTPAPVKVILGGGSIGDASDPIAKFTTPQQVQDLVDLFRKHGHSCIDTARGYSHSAPGSSELLLGQTDAREWATIDTKFGREGCKSEKVREDVRESLGALGVRKVHILWNHAPDRNTPIAETCAAVDEAYKAGAFEHFGLSNFTPAEVEEAYRICEEKGYVRPSAYQGQYNPLTRGGEQELFPLLRRLGMRFYAYSPSAAGFFSGQVTGETNRVGSRWDRDTQVGKAYRGLFFKPEILEAAQRVRVEAERAGITGHAASLRWVLHHSKLGGDKDHGMIVGASSLAQMEENLRICAEGPLPEDLVKVVDEVWEHVKEVAPKPWM